MRKFPFLNISRLLLLRTYILCSTTKILKMKVAQQLKNQGYFQDCTIFKKKLTLKINIYFQTNFMNSSFPAQDLVINVVPSFGRVLPSPQDFQQRTIREIEEWKRRKGVLHERPADFDPLRYASFSVKEVVEDPVNVNEFSNYIEGSRLSRRLGF